MSRIEIRLFNIMCNLADPYIVCLTYLIEKYHLVKAPCGCNIMVRNETMQSFAAFGAKGISTNMLPDAPQGNWFQGRRGQGRPLTKPQPKNVDCCNPAAGDLRLAAA